MKQGAQFVSKPQSNVLHALVLCNFSSLFGSLISLAFIDILKSPSHKAIMLTGNRMVVTGQLIWKVTISTKLFINGCNQKLHK